MANEEHDSVSWYLLTGDNKMHGPTTLMALAGWVEQGLVSPGDKASRDKQNWLAVESIPELQLDWTTTLISGDKYGPFHISVVRRLVNEGLLSPEAAIKNHRTGETLQVSFIVKARPPVKFEPDQQKTAPAPDSINASKKESQLLERLALMEQQLADCKAEKATFLQQLHAQKSLLSDRENISMEADQLRLRVQELEKTNRDYAGAIEEEKRLSAGLQQQIAAANTKARDDTSRLEDELNKTKTALEEASSHAGNLDKELSAERNIRAKLQQMAAQREKELLACINEIEEELTSVTKLLSDAREVLDNIDSNLPTEITN